MKTDYLRYDVIMAEKIELSSSFFLFQDLMLLKYFLQTLNKYLSFGRGKNSRTFAFEFSNYNGTLLLSYSHYSEDENSLVILVNIYIYAATHAHVITSF